jgi:hypothetical protein
MDKGGVRVLLLKTLFFFLLCFTVILPVNFKRIIYMQKGTQKRVKMQSLYRPSAKSFTGYKQVPLLTISGNWLAQAGFNIGSIVEIILSENQLIIKKENEYEKPANT